MSESSSYNLDYRSHYYVDPRDHSSTHIHRNRYDSPRRVRDVSWISIGQRPSRSTHDPYARWFPPPSDHTDYPTPVTPRPVTHSSPTPSPTTQVRPEDEEEEEEEVIELHEENIDINNQDLHFDFLDAPQKHTGSPKGTRRWVGGFVKGLRKLPGLRKSSRSLSDSALSLGPHHENDPQFPTISSLNLRPLTPSAIAQTAELMDMPQPQLHQPPSPQHRAYPHAHRSSPPVASSPAYSAAADTVPQVLSTVDERSNEQTGTQDTHPPPHSSTSSHSRTHSHSHSHSRSHSSHSTAHPVIPNTTNTQSPQSQWKPSTATVTDYVTVPLPSPSPPTPFKRFLHTLEQLPWVESEQIVDPYFPGRSSRHRHHPNSPLDPWKPAASWYNNRHDSHPTQMPMGPSSATLLYGWPPQMPKAYSQPEIVYPQFSHGYAPLQPVFVYPSAIPPLGAYTYGDIHREAV